MACGFGLPFQCPSIGVQFVNDHLSRKKLMWTIKHFLFREFPYEPSQSFKHLQFDVYNIDFFFKVISVEGNGYIFLKRHYVFFCSWLAARSLRMTPRNRMAIYIVGIQNRFKRIDVLSFWVLMNTKTSRAQSIFIISLLYFLLSLEFHNDILKIFFYFHI